MAIATRDRPTLLHATLASLARMKTTRIKWELVIVDNGSREATGRIVEGFKDSLPLRLVCEPKPGKSVALNRVAPELTGRLACFSDDDILFPPDWLATACECARKLTRFGVFSGPVIPCWPRSPSSSFLNHPFAREALTWVDHGDEPGPWPEEHWPPGANTVYRRRLLDDEPFDPERGPIRTDRLIGNDTELAQRLAARKVRFYYEPRLTVRHMVQPHQMQPPFLWRRAYQKAKTLASLGFANGEPRWAGVPRWMFRETALRALATAQSWTGLSARPRIDAELHLAEVFGWIAGARLAPAKTGDPT